MKQTQITGSLNRFSLALLLLCVPMLLSAARYQVRGSKAPVETMFKSIMKQAGCNYIYPANMLKGTFVTVNIDTSDLTSALNQLFEGTPFGWKKKGNNITITRRRIPSKTVISGFVRETGTEEPLIGAIVRDSVSKTVAATNNAGFFSMHLNPVPSTLTVSYPGFKSKAVRINPEQQKSVSINLTESFSDPGQDLQELVVTTDRNEIIAMQTADLGRLNLTQTDILNTPVIFGEADVIKTIQLQPGVSAGLEGLAGMYVHGGAHDENLYMLDNIPLYQINHFAGLFSAFNADAIKNVDFYKSTFPAKYNGRLSSVMDVHTKEGSIEKFNGSFKLGLTSGALFLDGPLPNKKTTYSISLRRSWFDLLTIPGLAIYNATRSDKENKSTANYSFTDANLRLTHRFNDRNSSSIMFYYGDDHLKWGTTNDYYYGEDRDRTTEKNISRLRWGNIVASVGHNTVLSETLFGEFRLAYTRFWSRLAHLADRKDYAKDELFISSTRNYIVRNGIDDIIARADFSWSPASAHRITFGASATEHFFMPEHNSADLTNINNDISSADTKTNVNAFEASAYIGDDWDISKALRLNFGANLSLFNVSHNSHFSADPRVSVRWQPLPSLSIKGGYSRMTQFVHQLTQSPLSLPTDQWIPIMDDMKPQHSDKISVGAYYQFSNYVVSAEAYMKWMRNVVDYRDFYYILPDDTPMSEKLTQGKGDSKGIDFMITRRSGRLTGHVSYSLMWARRRFDGINHGQWFPARFDNRHKINILLSYDINSKWSVNASWTGMSGNRITLMTQDYLILDPGNTYITAEPWETPIADLNEGVNNFRLPFYHRLDLSANLKTKRGLWTFSIYNAYCNMNVITVVKNRVGSGYYNELYGLKDSFKQFRLLPLIPSVSYTWFF